MKYRKKPVVIDAVQVDTEHSIETLEGTMKASPGDWIITGVQGERYPCKPDIFEATYEPAELEAQTVTDEQLHQEWDELRPTLGHSGSPLGAYMLGRRAALQEVK